MVTLVVLAIGAALGVLMAVRRRRKARLAGLDATRPVFSIDPPRRSVGKRKHEAL